MTKLSGLVVSHYANRGLFALIADGLKTAGKDLHSITLNDLKSVDEFHIGGVQATNDLLTQLKIGRETDVLDIGSGIGGPARHMAAEYGAKVIGLDLTPEFVDTASQLTKLTNLKIKFKVGSALDMPFAGDSFDLATLIHVGMNLPDKGKLFSEAARVLRAGGSFAIYDVMRVGDGHPNFPVPWASAPEASFVETREVYQAAAIAAVFVKQQNARELNLRLNILRILKQECLNPACRWWGCT